MIGIGVVAIAVLLTAPHFDVIPRTVALGFPDPFCSRRDASKLIVFLHGWRGEGNETTWQNFPRLVCEHEDFGDADVLVVNYPTFMGRRNLHIAQLATWIDEELEIRDDKYKVLAIVAHSLGGLVGRQLVILRRLKTDDDRFKTMIEIATPHEGASSLTWLADVLGLSRPLIEETHPGSSFLVTQETQWENFQRRPRTACFTSPHDTVVSQKSALAQCDYALAHPQWDHIGLVKPETATDPRFRYPIRQLSKFLSPPDITDQ